MKGLAAAAVFLLATVGLVHAGSASINPISRVAILMQNVAKKIEADSKKEAEVFEQYQCWYKSVVGTMKESNTLAKQRIENLAKYIEDIEAGNINFTTEHRTLEQQVEEISSDIDEATTRRNEENQEFNVAKKEMMEVIESLEKSIEVLTSATKGVSLLQRSQSQGRLLLATPELRRALEVGRSFLNSEQVSLISDALDNYWQADAKHEVRSGKIQEMLKDMLHSFDDNLADAMAMEEQQEDAFRKRIKTRQAQLKATESALAAGNEENGERELKKQEAEGEKRSLEIQVSMDERYVEEADKAYGTKLQEFQERERLRHGEVAAISRARALLTSDEARDTSSKSMASQGSIFLEERSVASRATSCLSRRLAHARATLRRVGVKHGDVRLTMLSLELRGGNLKEKKKFVRVQQSIEKMIEELKKENDEDLEEKERCNMEREENTNTARRTAREVNDISARIALAISEVATLKEKIAAKVQQMKDLRKEIVGAKQIRDEETKEFEAKKGHDEASKSIVIKAMEVLKKFYEDEGLSLAQVGIHHPHETEEGAYKGPAAALLQGRQPGEAPPPPPATWSEPYGGAKGESKGIQSVMEMIVDDIESDIHKARKVEETAAKDFSDYMSDTEGVIADLESEKAALETTVGDTEEDISISRDRRGDNKFQLDEVMTYLRTIAPRCGYIISNFVERSENRNAEFDGLLEAQKVLEGGSFARQKRSVAEDEKARGGARRRGRRGGALLQRPAGDPDDC